MSHIVIIIDRRAPATSDEQDGVRASVEYVVPHDTSDQEIAQNVKRIVRQVRALGTESSE